MREKIVAGNWKMNKTLDEAVALTSDLSESMKSSAKVKVVVCPPSLYLKPIQDVLGENAEIKTGAQNCSEYEVGAYTGEISAAMLQSAGVSYVIIGHSERRQYFNEQPGTLAKKVDLALQHELIPIFCCGEMLDIRERNEHEALVRSQVEKSLFHLPAEAISTIVIAYEPVWAIGTGKTATTQQAQDMHAVIRKHIAGKYGQEVADRMPILYGGSVKPDNAKELFSCPDVDGGLIGGASLKAQDFMAIINAV
ncbi:MAG: triose-phosphate isomerase [Flammeovirgaceae bacterium]|nr:triose-phosphate isomerase [Flammeovirgaceae bacterium]